MLSAFKRASMRKQILISLMLAMVILMGIAGTISYFVALNQADEIFSARLATSARVLDALLSRSVEDASVEIPLVISLPKELSETNDDDSTPLGHPYETKLAFQLWHADGHLLVRSEFAPLYRLGPFKEGFSETSSMGHDWHVFTLKSNDVWVEVAEEVGLRGEIANNVGVYSSSPFFICSAVLFLLVNLIVIVGFRPLKQLAWVIEHRDPKDNSAILLTKTPKEILPVVQALNALFDRVSQVLARERRFTDSAAHELRTPLAALSLHAENVSSATTEEERAISLAQLMTGLTGC